MDLDTLRHSCSHIMASAVKALYPKVKLGIGPSIEDGFYYDFEIEKPFTDEDLASIEQKMEEIIKADGRFKKTLLPRLKAINLFKKLKEPYKTELIKDLKDKKVSIYQHGDFIDLCKGPHLKSSGEIKAFKLLSVAGAYWRGSEKNKMLQRIYGTAFFTQDELKNYLYVQEEAKKRDHRKLGKDLDYFSIRDEVGAGLVFYHPKGALLRMIIEDFIKKEHLKRGYDMVKGPQILRCDIWKTSGHYDYYKENMYIFSADDIEYAIKPMNCPAHILIYKDKIRSYRDLPLRFFELGDVLRKEKSGVLHGLLRVRGFTQDDAHIFCLKEQLEKEIAGVIDFVFEVLKIFGFNEYEVELSTQPEKFIGTKKNWEEATLALENSLKNKNIKYVVHKGEGAFYGPKIDIKLKDALGRAWQCATIQCDFALPERFNLTYVGEDGKEHRPIMLHRVVLGSLERFIGALMEHYAGALPLWLSPVQAVVIPISDSHHTYAEKVKKTLQENSIRVNVDLRQEKMQYKIREAQMLKIPYMLIVGDKEINSNSVAVRSRSGGDQGAMAVDEFVKKITGEVKEKT